VTAIQKQGSGFLSRDGGAGSRALFNKARAVGVTAIQKQGSGFLSRDGGAVPFAAVSCEAATFCCLRYLYRADNRRKGEMW